MEIPKQLPGGDEFLTSLKETGEYRIPFRREGMEDISFVDVIDSTGDYIQGLADQLGIKIMTTGCYTEEFGHHLWVRLVDNMNLHGG